VWSFTIGVATYLVANVPVKQPIQIMAIHECKVVRLGVLERCKTFTIAMIPATKQAAAAAKQNAWLTVDNGLGSVVFDRMARTIVK
jgi:hypothetical protein